MMPCLQIPYALLNSEAWSTLTLADKVALIESMASDDGTSEIKTALSSQMKSHGLLMTRTIEGKMIGEVNWQAIARVCTGYPLPTVSAAASWGYFMLFLREYLKPIADVVDHQMVATLSVNEDTVLRLWQDFQVSEFGDIEFDLSRHLMRRLVQYVWPGIEIREVVGSKVYLGITVDRAKLR